MFTVNVLSVSHRIIVADKDQVLVLTASDCAFVQWVNNAHIRLLLEAQQAILMELHTVAPIGTDTDHCPYYQSDLRDSTVAGSQFMQPHIVIILCRLFTIVFRKAYQRGSIRWTDRFTYNEVN